MQLDRRAPSNNAILDTITILVSSSLHLHSPLQNIAYMPLSY
jgi:hypothetical protein